MEFYEQRCLMFNLWLFMLPSGTPLFCHWPISNFSAKSASLTLVSLLLKIRLLPGNIILNIPNIYLLNDILMIKYNDTYKGEVFFGLVMV